MFFIRSLVSEYHAYAVKIIVLLSEFISSCSYYAVKGLVYVIFINLSTYQPSSCFKCMKLNMRSLYDIRSVSNAKYIFFIRGTPKSRSNLYCLIGVPFRLILTVRLS